MTVNDVCEIESYATESEDSGVFVSLVKRKKTQILKLFGQL